MQYASGRIWKRGGISYYYLLPNCLLADGGTKDLGWKSMETNTTTLVITNQVVEFSTIKYMYQLISNTALFGYDIHVIVPKSKGKG